MTTGNKLTSKLGEISYVICVLWIAGWRVKSISSIVRRLPGSVKGIAQRHFETPRSDMTLEQRQAILAELMADRRDGGRLSDHHFIAKPLWGAQLKPLRKSTVGAKLLTKRSVTPALAATESTMPKSRKAQKKWKKEEQDKRSRREAGGAERRGEKGSALEFLAKRLLTDPDERGLVAFKTDVGFSGQRRYNSGLQLRKYIDGTRVGGLGAVDFESTSVGSNLGMAPSTYKVLCIETLGIIRSMMKRAEYVMIEAIVDQDDFPWERATPTDVELGVVDRDVVGKKLNDEQKRNRAGEYARAKVYDEIRRVLDIVSVFEGLLTHEGFKARWGYNLKRVDKASRAKAQTVSEGISELLEQAGGAPR